MDKDIIKVKNINGIEEEVELVLVVNKNNKKYLLYRNKDNELFASYILNNSDKLYNDLTEEEYDMLEKIYQQGVLTNDK